MPASPFSSVSNELVEALRAPDAPRELRLFAARGMLPVERGDRIRALLAVLPDPDEEIAAQARQTLEGLSFDELIRFLEDSDPTEKELDAVSLYSEDPFVLERVVRDRRVSDETLRRMAATASGAPQEALIVNHVRLLRTPDLIEALLQNPTLTVDGRRRLHELHEEFFEKERRRKEQERLAQEAEEQRLRDEAASAALREEEAAAEGGEGTDQPAEGTEEEYRRSGLGEMFKRIAVMTVKEKVELAQKGTKEERRILIGDMNRMVSLAVLRCESITLSELEQICAMRHLAVELYQEIAATREWIRKPKIQLAMVNNPAVPLSITLPLIKFLNMRELRKIMLDRNLSEGVRSSARKLLFEKRRLIGGHSPAPRRSWRRRLPEAFPIAYVRLSKISGAVRKTAECREKSTITILLGVARDASEVRDS